MLPIAYLAQRRLTGFMTGMHRQYPKIARLKNVQEEIVSGLPETIMPGLARKIDAQLVIPGRAGCTTPGKLCFGSVSNMVKCRSDIPVRGAHKDGAGGEDTQQVRGRDIFCEQERSTVRLRKQLGFG